MEGTEYTIDEVFRRQWEWEDLPACDEGLVLLREFAEAHPSPYNFALQKGFVDVKLPVFRNLPKWEAFVKHRSSCEKCNEV